MDVPVKKKWLITTYENNPYGKPTLGSFTIFIEEGKTPVEWFIEEKHKEENQGASWALINFWEV